MPHKKNPINYISIPIPVDKKKTEYTRLERRADILQLIIKHGSPYYFTQQELADVYGVAQSQICRDMQELRTYIEKNVGKDIKSITDTLYRAAVMKAIKDGNYEDAITFVEKWNNWLWNIGAVEKEPQKIEINQSNAVIDEIIREIREQDDAEQSAEGKD
ncbi:MAG: hypothetical protein DRN17_00130 [Thermoplasmata archaeon]|nr:MAG: hypothetical protein DRN17_00130 [Thermoplasmata archaeon]